MKKPAKIAILNSIISIALCLVLMAGATLAVFTSKSATNIAVTSGSVNVVATPSLEKASSAEWSEQESGYTYPSLPTAGNRATFTNGGTVSIDGGKVTLDRITPGDSATVKITITNHSTIGIKYQLRATFGGTTELLNILEIDLACNNNALKIFDGTFSHLANENNPDKLSAWQTMEPASQETPATVELTLEIAFPMDISLDEARYAGETANITLAVYAVQGNAYTEDPKQPEANEFSPENATYTVGAADEGQYKILEAKEVEGSDFLYWAVEKSASKISRTAAHSGAATKFGEYLTSNPVYKFRVSSETYGTYHAVYRDAKVTSKIVRLSKVTPEYTVTKDDVESTITLMAEEELWDTFDGFTRTKDDSSTEIPSNDLYMYDFTVSSDDVGAKYTAKYVELDLEEYADYFDNTGAVKYEATILNKNVPRPKDVEEGAGGIDGGEGKGLDDYPLFNKGYTKGPFSTQLHKAVIDENSALTGFGSLYVMDSEGKLWSEKQYTADEAWTLYDAFQEEFTKDHGLPDGFFDWSNEEKYRQEYENYDELSEKFSDIVRDKMSHGGSVWMSYGHLYKHLEAENLYLGEVDDTQPAVEKRITATPRGSRRNYSPTITGLYAPAGEVITFKMSKEDFERTGGMVITIGMIQMNGEGKPLGEDGTKRPHQLVTQTTITPKTLHPEWLNMQNENGDYVFYFGSYIGGPIYVSPYNGGEPFTIDIKGAVEYQHYIYGVTTPEEFESREDCLTKVPFFDLYVSTEDIRFCGPSVYAKGLDWTNFVKVSRLWEQVARISKQFPNQAYTEYGVMFDYEVYLWGGALTWPYVNTVIAALNWMPGGLNYENIVKYGNWGNFHELNHCYQNFGWYDPEVNNNSINLVEFAMLTDVSSARQRDENGVLTGVSGWSSYTDPAYTLLVNADPENKTGLLNGSQDRNLCRYANIFYGFGIDRYIKSMQNTPYSGYGLNSNGVARGATEACGYNMSYYLNQVVKNSTGYNKTDYPMFVPVASPYEIGIGHAYNEDGTIGVDATTNPDGAHWEYAATARPYRIDLHQQSFKLDFENTLALPGRERDKESGKMIDTQFDWTIKCTEQPIYGTVDASQDGGKHFIYHPNDEAREAGTSGRMVFTVTYEGITGSAAAGIHGSVQLVVQFDQMPGTRPDYDQLDRTVYTYNSENTEKEPEEESEAVAIAEGIGTPKTAEELFAEAKTAWLEDIKTAGGKSDGTFADAMYMTTEANVLPESKKSENNTAVYFDDELHSAPANSFIVVSGIYTPKADGTYYLGLESLGDSALYISEDGTTYELFVACGPGFTNTEGAIAQSGRAAGEPYRAAKQITLKTDETIYFREVLAPDETNPNGDHVKMLWGDTMDVLKDQPTVSADHTGYAYRLIETVEEEYELEYWTDHEETYFDPIEVKQSLVGPKEKVITGNLQELSAMGLSEFRNEQPKLENLFNDNPYDFFAVYGMTDNAPLKLTAKLEDEITADSFIIHAYPDYAPIKFKLYVGNSEDLKEADLVYEQSPSDRDRPVWDSKSSTIKCSFKEEPKTFSYYRLEISGTNKSRKIENSSVNVLMLNGIEFGNRWNVKQPSDRDVEKLGNWENVRTNGSTFGYLVTANGATDSAPVSTLTVNFTGKELHIRALVGKDYGAVELLIDGVSIADIDLRSEETKWVDILSDQFLSAETLAKLTEALSKEGEHTLVIRSVEKFNVDAIYYR